MYTSPRGNLSRPPRHRRPCRICPGRDMFRPTGMPSSMPAPATAKPRLAGSRRPVRSAMSGLPGCRWSRVLSICERTRASAASALRFLLSLASAQALHLAEVHATLLVHLQVGKDHGGGIVQANVQVCFWLAGPGVFAAEQEIFELHGNRVAVFLGYHDALAVKPAPREFGFALQE